MRHFVSLSIFCHFQGNEASYALDMCSHCKYHLMSLLHVITSNTVGTSSYKHLLLSTSVDPCYLYSFWIYIYKGWWESDITNQWKIRMRFRFLINHFEGKNFLFLVLLEAFSELSCRKVFTLKVINTKTFGCAGQQVSLPTVQFIHLFNCVSASLELTGTRLLCWMVIIREKSVMFTLTDMMVAGDWCEHHHMLHLVLQASAGALTQTLQG